MIRKALSGYQERLLKLHEIAGNKVKRPPPPIAAQTPQQMHSIMQDWVRRTKKPRPVAAPQPQ